MSKQYRWPLDTSKLTFGDALALHKASQGDPLDALPIFIAILTRLAGVDARDLPYADAVEFFNESGEQLSAYYETLEIKHVPIELPAAFRAALEDMDDIDEGEDAP